MCLFFCHKAFDPENVLFSQYSQKEQQAGQNQKKGPGAPCGGIQKGGCVYSGGGSNTCRNGYFQWDHVAHDLEKPADAEDEIDKVGDKEAEKIPIHPIAGQQ